MYRAGVDNSSYPVLLDYCLFLLGFNIYMENGKLWRKHIIDEDPVSSVVEYSKAMIIIAFLTSAVQPETYWEKV